MCSPNSYTERRRGEKSTLAIYTSMRDAFKIWFWHKMLGIPWTAHQEIDLAQDAYKTLEYFGLRVMAI